MLRVGIVSEAQLYTDLLACVFERLGQVQIVTPASGLADVVVLVLNDPDPPEWAALPPALQTAKLVACWPTGDRGLVWSPGQTAWRELCPFGLSHLLLEVLAGRQPVTGTELPGSPSVR